jgi:ribosomal protein S18 acetylase RimI-like enzyme
MMEIKFRVAGETDLDIVLAFMSEYYAYDQIPFEASFARTALEKMFRDASLGRVWLICAGDQPIGYLAIAIGFSLEFGHDGFIDELYLRADYRGRGIGTQAMRFAEDAAREMGLQALHLEVDHDNVKAQALYRKQGYEDHDRYLLTKRLDR